MLLLYSVLECLWPHNFQQALSLKVLGSFVEDILLKVPNSSTVTVKVTH